MAYSFNDLHKALCHDKTMICEGQAQGDGEGQWGCEELDNNLVTEQQQTVSSLSISAPVSLTPLRQLYLPQDLHVISEIFQLPIVIHVLEVQMIQVYCQNMIVNIDVIWTVKYMNLKICMKKFKSPPRRLQLLSLNRIYVLERSISIKFLFPFPKGLLSSVY